MDYEFVPGRDDFPPDEIAMLRQQLAAMTKERDEIAAQARMLDRMVNERDEQLAAAKETDLLLRNLLCVIHRDGGHHITAHGLDQSVQDAMEAFYNLRDLPEQLAAALAACEAKDAALESLISHTLSCEHRLDEFHGLGNDSGSGCSIELCNASSALAVKPDSSALKAHDDALIEWCAVVCEDLFERRGIDCAAAIRELKEKI